MIHLHVARVAAFAALFTSITYALVAALHASIPLSTWTIYTCGNTMLATLYPNGTVHLTTVEIVPLPQAASRLLVSARVYADIDAEPLGGNATPREVLVLDARGFAVATRRVKMLLSTRGAYIADLVVDSTPIPVGVLKPEGYAEAMRILERHSLAQAESAGKLHVSLTGGNKLVVVRVYTLPGSILLSGYTANKTFRVLRLSEYLRILMNDTRVVHTLQPLHMLADDLLRGCRLQVTVGYVAYPEASQAMRVAAAAAASAAFFTWDYRRSRAVYARLVPERIRRLLKRRGG